MHVFDLLEEHGRYEGRCDDREELHITLVKCMLPICRSPVTNIQCCVINHIEGAGDGDDLIILKYDARIAGCARRIRNR